MVKQEQKVIIEVDEEGNTTVSVTGVKGKRCTEITKDIEKKLGTVVSQKKTTDYYAVEVNTEGRVTNG